MGAYSGHFQNADFTLESGFKKMGAWCTAIHCASSNVTMGDSLATCVHTWSYWAKAEHMGLNIYIRFFIHGGVKVLWRLIGWLAHHSCGNLLLFAAEIYGLIGLRVCWCWQVHTKTNEVVYQINGPILSEGLTSVFACWICVCVSFKLDLICIYCVSSCSSAWFFLPQARGHHAYTFPRHLHLVEAVSSWSCSTHPTQHTCVISAPRHTSQTCWETARWMINDKW